jgi:hypothetical protein
MPSRGGRDVVALMALLLSLLAAACSGEGAGQGRSVDDDVVSEEPSPATEVPDDVDGYGDDPVLDALWDDCAAGDDAACDELYRVSPVGSEYEEFGDTCGGSSAGGGCVPEDVGPYAYGDDPALDALWDDCAAGDDAACDELYRVSPVGSEYEEFGDTCGGSSAGGGCVPEDVGPYAYGDDPALDAMWDDCAAGDDAACDELYRVSPVGSEYEEFGDSCGGSSEGGGCATTQGGWSDAAEAVCAWLHETAGGSPAGGEDIDDEMALYEDWHAELVSDAVSELEAIGSASAEEQALISSMDEFAQLTSRAAEIYASQVIISEELNTISVQQARLVETIPAYAADLGVPSCGLLVDYG